VWASERCWQELARQLKGHPARVGYDRLNEPHLDRALKELSAGSPAYRQRVKETRGTLVDVNVFNRRMIAAIRWDGMNYELGSSPLPAAYSKNMEAGKTSIFPRRSETPHGQALKMK
jgi:hypothetical protein